MATFKAEVIEHHKKKDGTFNIKIRVTHHRVKRYVATPLFVTKDDMTRSLKIKNQKIIDSTDAIIKKYRDACNVLGEKLDAMTVDQVVEYVKGHKEKEQAFYLDIVQYCRKKIKEMIQTGHEGNARTYEIMLSALIQFTGRETVSVSEITAKFVEAFATWIQSRPEKKGRSKGYKRAVSLYLSNLRALHNMAKSEFNDEDSGVINIPLSPFAKFKVPKTPATRKRALSVDVIRAIVALPYTVVRQPGANRHNLAKDVFLLSFGLVGMNSIDLFNCDCLQDGRITYKRTKTTNRREDKAEISIKIEPEIMPLIEKYRDTTGERVFKFYRMYTSSQTFNCAVNKGLKQIEKKLKAKDKDIGVDDLEYYAARHSWATIARNAAKVDKYTVHAALNHVDDDMKTTDIYIDKDFTLIDEANRKVLDKVKLDIGSVIEPKKEGL